MNGKILVIASLWVLGGIGFAEEGTVKPAPPPAQLAEFKARDAVEAYKRQLRAGYTTVGVPVPLIDKLVTLDAEIYSARVAGDLNRVQALRQQQEALLTPRYVPRVVDYYSAHPYQADTGTITFPVWSKEAAVSINTPAVLEPGMQVVDLPLYQKKLREIYGTVGIPDSVITQLLPVDAEIYNAVAEGRNVSVAELQERQRRLVTDEQAEKLGNYFDAHPFAVRTPKATFTAWQRAKVEAAKATPGAPIPQVERQIESGVIQPAKSINEVEQRKENQTH